MNTEEQKQLDRKAAAMDLVEGLTMLGGAAPRVGVSVEHKVNLGKFESASASIHLHGLTVGMSDEEIEELLNVGRVAYDAMRTKLAAQVREIRAAGRSP